MAIVHQDAGVSAGASPDLTRQMFEALFGLQEALLPAAEVADDARALLDRVWPPEAIERLEPRIDALVRSLSGASQHRLARGIASAWEQVALSFDVLR